MLINKREFLESDGTIGYIESIFDSSNVLKSTYFPKINRLYIAFNRGNTYSFSNISGDIYNEFECAESQGVYFNKKINKNSEFTHRKEFTLYPEEIKDIKFIINEVKKEKNESE